MTNPFQKELKIPPAETSAKDKALELQASTQQKLQTKQLESLSQIANFDWKAVPPPMLAQMLVQIPFRGSGGDPDYFLAPWQAMIFAMRCFELGLSPFSDEVWFNPKNNKTNVTLSGKLKLARLQGLNLGPPHFERVTRKFNGKDDYGYRCSMSTGRDGDRAEYTAWHSEWFVARSPVWKEKPDHMLQVRATEKCLSFASGIGVSELPGEGDLGRDPERSELPVIESTQFTSHEHDSANKEMKQ